MCGMSTFNLYTPILIPFALMYFIAMPFIYTKEKWDEFRAGRRTGLPRVQGTENRIKTCAE